MTLLLATAKTLARGLLSGREPRLTHVVAVGELAESTRIVHPMLVPEHVVVAAWLHDVGYADGVMRSGFHPLDGACYLRDNGWPAEVCSLVAFHTGAEIEAEERGIPTSLSGFKRPLAVDLDMLTMFDLSVGPQGQPLSPPQRIADILHRYGEQEPVHRAIRRSGDELIESAQRAAHRLTQHTSE